VEFDAEFSPEDFTFTVTGNDPFPEEFAGVQTVLMLLLVQVNTQ
jgi:hypothetical protein